MNIENFVSEALEQLGAGIAKAHGKPGITISPSPYMRDDPSNTAGDHLVEIGTGRLVVFVAFDLSVVIRSQIAGEAGAKLEVLGFDLGGGKLESGLDHTRVQRIKFQVPVSFPEDDTVKPAT
jgi:hypothetical protein